MSVVNGLSNPLSGELGELVLRWWMKYWNALCATAVTGHALHGRRDLRVVAGSWAKELAFLHQYATGAQTGPIRRLGSWQSAPWPRHHPEARERHGRGMSFVAFHPSPPLSSPPLPCTILSSLYSYLAIAFFSSFEKYFSSCSTPSLLQIHPLRSFISPLFHGFWFPIPFFRIIQFSICI